MGIKLPKRAAGSTIGRQPLVEMLKNQRSVAMIKEQMVRFVHRILNEENGMSCQFINCVLMHSVQTNAPALNTQTGSTVNLNQNFSMSPAKIVNENAPAIDLKGLSKPTHRPVVFYSQQSNAFKY